MSSIQRIIIRHLSGSKAHQVQEFPVAHVKELILGRDETSTIKYDPGIDDLVSRHHTKIVQDPNDENKFLVTDLNSTNGTYVNKQRISDSIVLSPGDVVQLGPNGPEFAFDLEPRPKSAPGKTRVDDSLRTGGYSKTRVSPAAAAYSTSADSAPSKGIGKRTLELFIGEMKGDVRKKIINATAIALGAVIVVGGLLYYWVSRETQEVGTEIAQTQGDITSLQKQQTERMTPEQIGKTYRLSNVFIENAWKLVNTATGKQLFFKMERPKGNRWILYFKEFKEEAKEESPTFVEPWLVEGQGVYPVGSIHTGSGFVVSNNGLILTNKHVVAGETMPFQDESFINVIAQGTIQGKKCKKQEPNKCVNIEAEKAINYLRGWTPSKTKQFGTRGENQYPITGRTDVLRVTFPDSQIPVNALVQRVHRGHDVALISITPTDPLVPVDMNELTTDPIIAGSEATVMGYPGVSEGVQAKRVGFSKIFGDPGEPETYVMQEPTVTPTSVTLLPGQGFIEFDEPLSTPLKDYYQLATSATGAGNSGGPVFNNRGKVIGIFAARRIFAARTEYGGAKVTYAIPIQYGRDLLK